MAGGRSSSDGGGEEDGSSGWGLVVLLLSAASEWPVEEDGRRSEEFGERSPIYPLNLFDSLVYNPKILLGSIFNP